MIATFKGWTKDLISIFPDPTPNEMSHNIASYFFKKTNIDLNIKHVVTNLIYHMI